MMKNDNLRLNVALVKELCPICCKEIDGPIILGKKLTVKPDKKIEELQGKVVGFSAKPCPECQKLIDDGCYFIIGYHKDKTEDFRNPYRNGHILGLKKDCDFVKNLPKEQQDRNYVFMDHNDMIKCGMITE